MTSTIPSIAARMIPTRESVEGVEVDRVDTVEGVEVDIVAFRSEGDDTMSSAQASEIEARDG